MTRSLRAPRSQLAPHARRVHARPARRRPDPVPDHRRSAGHAVGPGPDAARRQPERATTTGCAARSPGCSASSTRSSWAGRRGATSVAEIRADLDRIRAWSGLDPVAGDGITITIRGPIGAPDVEDVINELRNAGAEAIAIDDVRVVTGTVDRRVAGVDLASTTRRLRDPFTIRAIGGDGVADRVADPGRRHRRPARGDESGRRPRHPADGADDAAGHDARPRAEPRPPAALSVRLSDTLGRMTGASPDRAAPRRRRPAAARPSVRRRRVARRPARRRHRAALPAVRPARPDRAADRSSGGWPGS